MSAVIIAVFNDHDTAEGVLISLVRDGFPTDRVTLTAERHLGRAGHAPAETQHGKCVQYFNMLLKGDGKQHYPELLARYIAGGAATVTVHPRGTFETQRATEILQQARPVDVVGRDLTNHGWNRAAGKHTGYWVQHVWLEPSPDTDCIYCRLFPVNAVPDPN
jgi:hypothetical protein